MKKHIIIIITIILSLLASSLITFMIINNNKLICKGPGILSSPCTTNEDGTTTCSPFGNSNITIEFSNKKIKKIKVTNVVYTEKLSEEDIKKFEEAFNLMCTNHKNVFQEDNCNITNNDNKITFKIEMNQDNFNFFKGYNTRSDIKKYITKELTKNYTDAKYVCN